MKNIVLLASLCLLFLTSCGTTKTKKPSYDRDVLNTTSWILQNENQAELGMGDEPITISFDVEEANVISGFAGCNYYGGNYSIQEKQLLLNDIYATKRACPALETETEYLQLLGEVDNFEIKGKNLYMYKGKLLLLHFKK